MASQFYWNGQLYTSPTVVSVVNDSGFGPSQLGTGNTLAILGESMGGQPNVPLSFTSPAQAQATLIAGDLLTAVAKAFDASPITGNPGTIIAMRVGQAAQATGVVLDNQAYPIINLTSTQYGLPAAQTQFSVEQGSEWQSGAPTYLVSASLGTTSVSQDNIQRTAFTTTYTGPLSEAVGPTETSATIQVSDTSVILCAPAATVVATILLANFPTVDQLVAQINAAPGFSCVIGLNATGTPTANALDFLPGPQSCISGYTTTANVQAIIEWFNNSSGLVTATRNTGHATGYQPAVTYPSFLTYTGTIAPAPTNMDFSNALVAMQSVACNWMSVLTPYTTPSTNESIWAAVVAHVEYMSIVAKMERRAFVGTFLGDSIAAVEGYPIALNSDRVSFCYPGYKDFDVNGNLTTFGSYMTAGLIGACFAGIPPGTAMTNQPVTVQGLEVNLANPGQTDPLIQSGVLCLQATKTGYSVVRSISTWLVNNNFDKVEVSTGAACDFVAQSLRAAVQPFLGKSQGPSLLGLALSAMQSILTDLAKPLPNGPGVIVGDSNSPAFQNLTVNLTGDQLICACQVSPVIPNNFIGISISLQAYSGSASA